MQILAAVVRNAGRFDIGPVELDMPRAGEVLVRIAACGICHTDLAVLEQSTPWPLPAVLGHEGAGVVEEVGPAVRRVRSGDRVILSYASCGECARCQHGLVAYCDKFLALNFSGRRLDGTRTHHADGVALSAPFFYQSSFATYALTSERNLVAAPDDLPLSTLAPLGCGVQTGAGAVFNRLKPEPGSGMAVFGMGAVGLSAVLAADVCGCSPIIAVDLVESRLRLARELGATHVLKGDQPELLGSLRELSGGGVMHAVEATGVPKVMALAASALRVTGAVVMLGVPASADLCFARDIMRGITIHSSIEGDSDPAIMIPRLIELHRAGRLPFDRMIRRFEFEAINEAVLASKTGEVVKPVLVIDAHSS